jgi:polyphenol oxidase
VPDWPAPPNVRAHTTTRHGGVSRAPFSALNLGEQVGDDPAAVRENRARLLRTLGLTAEPQWLQQVHGCTVARAGETAAPVADACYALRPGIVCAVLTADCLPVLLCDRAGSRVAAVHAGWRGLAHGVIEAALDSLAAPGQELLAWLGPAIGPDAFEVGDEVRDTFIGRDARAAAAFRPSRDGRWRADLYALARQRLAARGVSRVFGGGLCTYSDPDRFYSYRREGQTGRMATLIWLAGAP